MWNIAFKGKVLAIQMFSLLSTLVGNTYRSCDVQPHRGGPPDGGGPVFCSCSLPGLVVFPLEVSSVAQPIFTDNFVKSHSACTAIYFMAYLTTRSRFCSTSSRNIFMTQPDTGTISFRHVGFILRTACERSPPDRNQKFSQKLCFWILWNVCLIKVLYSPCVCVCVPVYGS